MYKVNKPPGATELKWTRPWSVYVFPVKPDISSKVECWKLVPCRNTAQMFTIRYDKQHYSYEVAIE